MQFLHNIYAVNLHKEIMMCVVQNCDAKCEKKAGYYPCNRGKVGIYRNPVVRGRLLLVAKYWWLTLYSNHALYHVSICGC